MKVHRKKKLLIILGGITGFSLALILILFGLEQNVNAFYTPTDVADGKAPLNRLVRIGGLVKEGSVGRNPENLKVSFTLQTDDDEILVKFEGILPDLFREGQGIVTQGKLVSKTEFAAVEVLAKHDENYMSPDLARSLEKIKHEKGESGNPDAKAKPYGEGYKGYYKKNGTDETLNNDANPDSGTPKSTDENR